MKRDEDRSLDLDTFVLDDAGFESANCDVLDASLLTVHEWREIVAAHLFEIPERLDVRVLWSRNGSSFCRVNVWQTNSASGERRVCQSRFFALDDTPDGPRVRDLTDRRAA